MMKHTTRIALAMALLATIAGSRPAAQQQPRAATAKPLEIYVMDVEGGAAKLFISPSGESVLVDTGSPGGRDVDRIMAAVEAAGVKQIDHLVLTHYHSDHVGGVIELAKRIPIRHYIDHGPSIEPRDPVPGFNAAYPGLYGQAKHTVVKPGDRLTVAGLEWRIVASAGKVHKTPPLPGGGQRNPACSSPNSQPREPGNDPENGQSVGSVITFGKFKALELGDLLWNQELELMCPNNPLGTIDLYFVTHHGTDPSGPEAAVHGIRPRVAIMQNGTRKGATLQTMRTLRSAPRLEDIWLMHWSYNGLLEYNPPGLFIANIDEPAAIATILTTPPPAPGAGRAGGGGAPAGAGAGAQAAGTPAPGAAAPATPAPGSAGAATPGAAPATQAAGPAAAPGTPQGAPPAAPGGGRVGGGGGGGRGGGHTGPAFWFKVSAQTDGSFTVTNSRNGFTKTYPAQ